MKKIVLIALATVVLTAVVVVVIVSGGSKSNKTAQPKASSSQVTEPQAAADQAPSQSSSGSTAKPQHAAVALNNGAVAIDAQGISDGQARFYTVELSPGAGQPPKPVDFFVVKDTAGVYRAAADACQVCWQQRKGFRQEGAEMVCNNCGNRYPVELIATQKGGCNPGPINPNLQPVGGAITIGEAELQQVAQLF